MIKEQLLSDIQDIFRTVFKNQSISINVQTCMDDLDEWDSLSHVVLIDTIEKKYNIKFELRDMLDIEKVDDICNCVVQKTSK